MGCLCVMDVDGCDCLTRSDDFVSISVIFEIISTSNFCTSHHTLLSMPSLHIACQMKKGSNNKQSLDREEFFAAAAT